MHSFLERDCGRFGTKNSMPIRVALKATTGPNNNKQGARKKKKISDREEVQNEDGDNETSDREDIYVIHKDGHDEDTCDHDDLHLDLNDFIFSAEDKIQSVDQEVVPVDSQVVEVPSVKRPKVSKVDLQKRDNMKQLNENLDSTQSSTARELYFNVA